MRVGLVIYGSLETRSGGYLYDRKLVAALRNQGDEVTIFSLPWRSYSRHLLQNLWGDWARALARAPLDILIQDELNHPSLFLLNRRLKRETDYPVISLIHHLRVDEGHPPLPMAFYRAVERRYLRSVDGLICNSNATLASVQALSGVKMPAVVAHPGRAPHPPALTNADILARAQEPGPLRLLFVGNVIPRKGLHILLDALARLPDEMARLTIVGDNAIDARYIRQLEEQIHQLGLTSRVNWAGAVSDAHLRELYADHHALVVPSRHEGFGIVYLEAMAYGLVAVGTESGGAGEIIRPGETGLLVPPDDPETLAGRLLWLAGHRREMGDMGVAARRAWLAHPTWEETGGRIRAFLVDMASSA